MMTDPEPLDLSALTATPVAFSDHIVPDHTAGTETVAPQPKTVRERLMEATQRKNSDGPRARNVKPTRARKSVPNVPGQFVKPLTDFYNTMAFATMPFKPAVAVTLLSPCEKPTEDNPNPLTVAENCAKAWDEAAQRSESVRRMLDGFVTVSVWGALISAHTPLIAAALQGTKLEEKLNPAAAMEAFLRRREEQDHSE